MAKANQQIINGYPIPSGKSGVGVRRACELVVSNPGIKQSDLLQAAAEYSKLNLGTASWLTSPGNGKLNPVDRLWERRKEGRGFSCYPNEYTGLVTGAADAAIREYVSHALRTYTFAAAIKPGELIRFDAAYSGSTEPQLLGIFFGWTLIRLDTRPEELPYKTFLAHPSEFIGREEFFPEVGASSICPAVMCEGKLTTANGVWIRKP